MRFAGLIAAVAIGVLAPAGYAQTEYVRDTLRINMRTGPGNQFRILRVLSSGDEVRKLDESDGWVNIRTPDGQEGWVPTGYVTPELPPSIELPQSRAKLEQAQGRIQELEARLEAQTQAITELAKLRTSNRELLERNTTLASSSTWRNLATGGAIALGGLLLGLMYRPRDRSTRQRRIKL